MKKRILLWGVCGFFCTTIHLYFAPMCGAILLGFEYLSFAWSRKYGDWHKAIQKCISDIASFLSGLLLPMWIFGGFIEGMDVSNQNIDWKKSFNLLSFFAPQKWSRVLPELELFTSGQSEGFAYLGLGVFALSVLLLGAWITLRILKKPHDGVKFVGEKFRWQFPA